jgi:hypothetical protein
MGSGAMIYVPSFITIGSGIQEFLVGVIQTHRQQGDLISQLYFFFQNKENRLKMIEISELRTNWVKCWFSGKEKHYHGPFRKRINSFTTASTSSSKAA